MMLNVYPVRTLHDNYVWTLVNSKQQAIIIDPGEAAPVINFLNASDLSLRAILVTHKHWDHTNGIAEITQHFDVPVFGPKHDYVATVTNPLEDNHIIELDHFPLFRVIDIPGHTLGHIAYVTDDLLFSGDTLFSAGCGKIFEGTPKQMVTSLQRLTRLPNATRLYCGHEYTLSNLRFAKTVEPNNQLISERITLVQTLLKQGKSSLPVTLEIEKQTNPFLRCDQPEIVQVVEKFAGKPLQTEVEVFAFLRELKNQST